MSGTVHVIAPPAGGFAPAAVHTEASVALLAGHLCEHPGEPVICLGPNAAARSMRAFGIEPSHRVLPRRGRAGSTARPLSRMIERMAPRSVTCWGLPAAEAVVRGRPACTISAHLDSAPRAGVSRRTARSLGSITTYHEADRDAWISNGADPDAVGVGASAVTIPHDTRAGLRSALGIHRDALVIAPCVDPPAVIDARRFLFRMGFLELLNRPTVALLPAGCRRLAAGRAFRAAASLRFRLLVLEAPLSACYPACDAVIPLSPSRGLPLEARGAHRVLGAVAESLGVRVIEPDVAPNPTVVSREIAESFGPVVAQLDALADREAGV